MKKHVKIFISAIIMALALTFAVSCAIPNFGTTTTTISGSSPSEVIESMQEKIDSIISEGEREMDTEFDKYKTGTITKNEMIANISTIEDNYKSKAQSAYVLALSKLGEFDLTDDKLEFYSDLLDTAYTNAYYTLFNYRFELEYTKADD